MMAARSRRRIAGMTVVVPMPLAVADITAVLEAHPSPLPRSELDFAVFALDAEYLSSLEEKPAKAQDDVESVWGGVVSAVNAG